MDFNGLLFFVRHDVFHFWQLLVASASQSYLYKEELSAKSGICKFEWVPISFIYVP